MLLLPEHVPSARDLHLRRLPLNPIGLEPGWRKLRREIDWLNPLIIRISQRGPADCAFGGPTVKPRWECLALATDHALFL